MLTPVTSNAGLLNGVVDKSTDDLFRVAISRAGNTIVIVAIDVLKNDLSEN